MEATRAWRQGVRTVILLNDTLPSHLSRRRDYRRHASNEVYLTYQDVDNSAVWWLKKGDLRRALCNALHWVGASEIVPATPQVCLPYSAAVRMLFRS